MGHGSCWFMMLTPGFPTAATLRKDEAETVERSWTERVIADWASWVGRSVLAGGLAARLHLAMAG